MIRQMLQLLWNRKASNALILAEIAVSFLVLFALAALSLYLWDNSRRPMGFELENVWSLGAMSGKERGVDLEERGEIERTLLRELRSMDRVEAAAVVDYMPYDNSSSTMDWDFEGRQLHAERIMISDDAPEVLGLRLVAGRWLQEGDDLLSYLPVLVDQSFVDTFFPGQDGVGQTVDEASERSKETRIVGVIEAYRKAGEFSAQQPLIFMRSPPGNPEWQFTYLGLRLAPGTPAQYEEAVLDRMAAVAPGWTFFLRQMEEVRGDYRRGKLMQLLLASLIAGFLLLMVALGLLGVLWQNVTQRTREIGLRRAIGAHAGHVHTQVLGEVIAVALCAVLLGTLLLVQIPMAGWFDFLSLDVTLAAYAVATAAILMLVTLCALYPSWLASRVRPAEALHYE